MSEVEKASGQDQVASGDEINQQSEQQIRDDKVSYETYKKTLAAEKKAKERAKELESKLTQYEQADLESKGKQAELIESLRKQLSEKEKKVSDMLSNFAFQSLTKAVEVESKLHGCIDPEAALKFIDLNAIEIRDDFTANSEDVKRAISDIKQKKPYLFQKPVPSVKDAMPGVNKDDLNGKKDLSKMSLDEKLKLLAEATAGGMFAKRK
jgi:hypothetical protein